MAGETVYQSTVITIFSLWNTMMGTTLLAIPWTITQAGFTLGIFLTLFMAALDFYTCTLIVRMSEVMRQEQVDPTVQVVEFSDVCRYFVGPKFAKITVTISLMTLMTAAIAYWILMSGFLFEIGLSIRGFTNNTVEIPSEPLISMYMPPGEWTWKLNNATNGSTPATTTTTFDKVWTKQLTPVILIAIVFPLTLFRTPTIFIKLNSVGVLSIFYVIALVGIKAAEWGLNFNFCKDPTLKDFSSSFPALTGTMTLGFFLHNAVIAMLNPSNPVTRIRDLGAGYILVLMTYLYIGLTIYMTFPQNKGTLQDNFLKNFASSDIVAFVARVGLLLQMVTTFPLLVYITRLQFVRSLLGKNETLLFWRILLGAVIVGVGVLLAIVFPNIGTVLRISGSLSGLAFAFTLPCVVYLQYLRRDGKATHGVVWGHVLIITFGFVNFLLQFLI